MSRLEQRIPAAPPDHLDDVPTGAAEDGFELLDDLAVAAHRTVEALQVAVDDEDQVVELLAGGERNRAERFGLVHFPVAHECPHLAIAHVGEAASLEIFHEAGLVDGGDRTEAHRHRRKLPEIGHQPWMGIRGQALAVDLLAKMQQLIFAQTAFDEGAGVDARGGMALDIDQIAGIVRGRRVPEMPEADVVKGRGGLEARDMAAQRMRLLVGLDHGRERIPADDGTDAAFDLAITGIMRLAIDRDRIHIGRVGVVGEIGAARARFVEQVFDQKMGAVDALGIDHCLQRIEPFAGFFGIDIFRKLSLGFRMGNVLCHWTIAPGVGLSILKITP